MNTRLQVEHPVTELTTGLDLVHLQLRIAAGEKLPFAQSDVQIRGHAIECRIYAEDPDNNYFPSPGKITVLLQPAGPGIRRDSGMYEGWNVPMDYDPLLAKLIGYGTDRQQAIMRLDRALYEYFVAASRPTFRCSGEFCATDDFRAGKLDTGYLDRLLAKAAPAGASAARDSQSDKAGKNRGDCLRHVCRAGAVGTWQQEWERRGAGPVPSNWKQKGRRKRCADLMCMKLSLAREAAVEQAGKLAASHTGSSWKKPRRDGKCRLDGQVVHIDAVLPRRDVLSLLVDGHAYEIKREQTATDLHMWVGSTRFAVELRDPRSLRSRQKAGSDERDRRKFWRRCRAAWCVC